MWIDTHCHLDAAEFDADRDAVVARAESAGVSMVVMPSGHVDWFDKGIAIARRHGYAYGLGLHPCWLDGVDESHLDRLQAALDAAKDDPQLVAVGEIGLDFFIAGFDAERQQQFYRAQLKLARDRDLPVILHVRRSADVLLKWLRRIEVPGGIAHAFNGSIEQAQAFVDRGFKLGFGGAMTYDGSKRIRALAASLPDNAIVVETDGPDIPPQWLRPDGRVLRNEPAELPRIAATLAQLRGTTVPALAELNRGNACAALPRLPPLLGGTT